MSKNTTQPTISLLRSVPARVTTANIKDIIHTLEVYDTRADKANARGDFNKATYYADFVFKLDALLASVSDKSPVWEKAF